MQKTLRLRLPHDLARLAAFAAEAWGRMPTATVQHRPAPALPWATVIAVIWAVVLSPKTLWLVIVTPDRLEMLALYCNLVRIDRTADIARQGDLRGEHAVRVQRRGRQARIDLEVDMWIATG